MNNEQQNNVLYTKINRRSQRKSAKLKMNLSKSQVENKDKILKTITKQLNGKKQNKAGEQVESKSLLHIKPTETSINY